MRKFSALSVLPPIGPALAPSISRLSDLMRQAKSVVVFTGAGMSTHAGIPDYRSTNGVWSQQAILTRHKIPKSVQSLLVERGRGYVTRLQPTPAHMAIASLVASRRVDMVITQNLDGLHQESGIPVDKQAQLHGNIFKECCPKCKTEYIRTQPVKILNPKKVHDHRTGARCTTLRNARPCKGELEAFVVNFGDELPAFEMRKAVEACSNSDLVIVIGSSMTVTPACEVPLIVVGKATPDDFLSEPISERILSPGKLVIINSQPTTYDSDAELVIRNDCQIVMSDLVSSLGIGVSHYEGARLGVTPEFISKLNQASIDSVVSHIKSLPKSDQSELLDQLSSCLKECRTQVGSPDTNPFSLELKLTRILSAFSRRKPVTLAVLRGGMT